MLTKTANKLIKGKMVEITTTSYRNLSEDGVTPQELNSSIIYPVGTYDLNKDLEMFLFDKGMSYRSTKYTQKINPDKGYAYHVQFFFGVVTITYYIFMIDHSVKNDLNNYTTFHRAWNYIHNSKIVDEAISEGFILKEKALHG